MYARNSTGPMTKPWGAPERTARKLDFRHPPYALLPIFKESFTTLQSVASNTIILQFIKKL